MAICGHAVDIATVCLPERPLAFREIRSVLRPSGRLAFHHNRPGGLRVLLDEAQVAAYPGHRALTSRSQRGAGCGDLPSDYAPQREGRLQPPGHPGPSDEGGEDAAADERTSPFPYAERFDEWVTDETAAPGGRQPRRVTGDTDGSRGDI